MHSASRPEILYRRLMSIVDDYGRFDFDADLIPRWRAFPRQLERWPTVRIREVLLELHCSPLVTDAQPLITVYSFGRKKYFQINNFNQRLPGQVEIPGPSFTAVHRGSR